MEGEIMDNMVTKDLASNIKFNNVNITDRFFGYYQNLIINEVIPYQWKVLNDELEDDIIEKNHNVYPKFKDYKVELLEVVDHWYKFAGIAQVDGIDLHSEYFYYWLKEGSFTILKEEI